MMRFPFLADHGILGINARNLLFIKPFNPKKAIAFADDKLKTKAFLAARGIPVARIFARIESREQLYKFDFATLPDECVLKPNEGYGGEGIVILRGRKNGVFLRNGKEPMEKRELLRHIEDILDGKFSLGGRRDVAFFEQILTPHECFAPFRPVGLPDIRVIVFNLVPVMAMLRIPTMESDGKANLHLGGLGIGVDLAKGTTTYAAQYHHIIDELPHGTSPAGIRLPFWEEILLMSARIQQITNIGYLACDITISREIGPALLEVNARAGLTVQLANLAPLRKRLERIEGVHVSSPEKGVRIGQDLFGEKVKLATEEGGDRTPVLGSHEVLTVIGDGSTTDIPCRIKPGEERTTFAGDLLAELRKQGAAVPEGKAFRVKFLLAGHKVQTLVLPGTLAGPERAIVGRRDLAGFLIDPLKGTPTLLSGEQRKSDLRAADRLLAAADRELSVLRLLKPVNLTEERARAESDHRYNPLFLFPESKQDLDDLERRLLDPLRDTSPLGTLLEKKRLELLSRIALLRTRGDAEGFTLASRALFGAPDTPLLEEALSTLRDRIACSLPPREKSLSAEEAKEILEETLMSYNLQQWSVSILSKVIADCTVGGRHITLRSGATFSREHLSSLTIHEIESHVLTAE
ncbi:MAG: DUF1704 domain-containing protein, partial [Candidatus Peribacteraceae bacterium]|nr:DUF1704 domain-containing protein [Candidatus Peribacteraceae bacterium]